MKIHDDSAAFAKVVPTHRRSRAPVAGERFRLVPREPDSVTSAAVNGCAVLGASAWALRPQQVERTLALVGTAGGLLADLGFRISPISNLRQRPSLVIWICGEETSADEHRQLRSMGVPVVAIDSHVEGLDDWTSITMEEAEDRHRFNELFPSFVNSAVRENR